MHCFQSSSTWTLPAAICVSSMFRWFVKAKPPFKFQQSDQHHPHFCFCLWCKPAVIWQAGPPSRYLIGPPDFAQADSHHRWLASPANKLHPKRLPRSVVHYSLCSWKETHGGVIHKRITQLLWLLNLHKWDKRKRCNYQTPKQGAKWMASHAIMFAHANKMIVHSYEVAPDWIEA